MLHQERLYFHVEDEEGKERREGQSCWDCFLFCAAVWFHRCALSGSSLCPSVTSCPRLVLLLQQPKTRRTATQSEEKKGKSRSFWLKHLSTQESGSDLAINSSNIFHGHLLFTVGHFCGSSLPSWLLFSHSPDLPLVSWHYISAKAVWQRC